MRKATAILISMIFAALLAACDTKQWSDTWHLTRDGVMLVKAGGRQAVRISLPGWVWAGEPYGCGPALAVGPHGEAVVTSDVAPIVWRVDPVSLEVSVHALKLDRDTGEEIGFSVLAYSSEQGAFIGVSSTHGSLWKIDGELTRAERIGRPEREAARAQMQIGCGARLARLS